MSSKWRPRFELDGIEVEDGTRTHKTRTGWAYPTPVECRNGHSHEVPDGAWQASWTNCRVMTDGGHRTYYCTERGDDGTVCGDVVYVPAERSDCDHRAFDNR